jgi:hypothetical protein
MTLNEIIEELVALTDNLHSDVKLASTRLEHIRLTARANEATNLLHNLMNFQDTDDTETKTTNGE